MFKEGGGSEGGDEHYKSNNEEDKDEDEDDSMAVHLWSLATVVVAVMGNDDPRLRKTITSCTLNIIHP